MPIYRLYVPLSEQTKDYLVTSKNFLESIGHNDEDLFFLLNYALKLFEGYLDLLTKNSVILGFSEKSQFMENIFDMQGAFEAMYQEQIATLPVTVLNQAFYDLIENVKIKSLAQNHAEAIIYAICYFAFLVGILESGGDIVLGRNFGDGSIRIYLYDIDLFRSYHSIFSLPN